MLVSHFFDLIPIWLLLIGTVVLMVAFIEFGFRLGCKAQKTSKKAQTSQVRAIMGYQAGLTDKRSPVATITLALAFSAVIILISDLDRPVMSLFDINNQLFIDLNEYMQSETKLEYYPGD